MIQEDILHGVLIKSLISQDWGRTLLARYNQFSCFIRREKKNKSLLTMVKGNDCGAERGKLHSALSQSPGHPGLKSLCPRHIWNERKHSFGVCRGCISTMVCTHRIIPRRSCYQSESGLVCLDFSCLFHFKQSWSISLAGLELNL